MPQREGRISSQEPSSLGFKPQRPVGNGSFWAQRPVHLRQLRDVNGCMPAATCFSGLRLHISAASKWDQLGGEVGFPRAAQLLERGRV